MTLLPIIILLGLMYLLLMRPQQQRVKAQRALIESLAVGDEVVTVGGLRAKIVELDAQEARLEVAPGVVLTFVRQAVNRKIVPDEGHGGGDDSEGVLDEPMDEPVADVTDRPASPPANEGPEAHEGGST